jgi:hypothetical protein
MAAACPRVASEASMAIDALAGQFSFGPGIEGLDCFVGLLRATTKRAGKSPARSSILREDRR